MASPRDESASATFDFSGIKVRARGLPGHHLRRLEEDWALFLSGDSDDLLLDAHVETHEEAGEDKTPFAAKEMTATFDGSTARYHMKEGSADVPLAGPARIHLARTTRERQYLALVNLVSAAVAWRLPSRGGALLHAAGIVVEGRAFVLVGPEGSGKTTWARLAKEAGAKVLSDDIVLVDAAPGGRIEALGSPFRVLDFGPPGPGRWPVAALLLSSHGARASLAPAPPLLARARLVANLPFVAPAWADDPRVEKLVESLVAAVPARVLAFALDSSFVDLLHRFDG